jgi:anionic cell wall polymer biosynthesis LytR-Cps2A-Psr (LCP) family protein
MARQKCVMAAMLDQLDPTDVLKNFQKIAKASSAMVQTSIPASEVDRFIGLALKARDQKVSTLSIVPPLFDTYEPDAKLIRAKVAEAIDTAEGTAPKAAVAEGDPQAKPGKNKNPKQPDAVTGGSVGSLGEGYAANESQDLDSAC